MEEKKEVVLTSTPQQLKWGNILFWLCWFVYFSAYIGRINFSGSMPDILATTGWSKDAIGLVGTGFFFAYGIGQLINGFLGDRISPIIMIFGGLALSCAVNAAMTFAPNPTYMLVFWCINGYALSMIWSPIVRLFSEWMPPEQRMRAGVNISTPVPVGTLASYGLTALLVAVSGWRASFMGAAVILCSTAIIWLVMMPRIKTVLYNEEYAARKKELDRKAREEIQAQGAKVSFFKVALMSGMIFVAISVMFDGVIKDGVTTWVPTYISEYFKLDSVVATLITTVLPVINLAGVYVASWMNRKLRNNETTTGALMFGIGLIAMAMLSLFGKYSVVLAILFLSVSTAAMMGANAILIGIIPLYFGKIGKASSFTGFLNSMSYVASAIAMYGIGALVQSQGWDATIWWWVATAFLGGVICMMATRKWMKYKRDYCDEI